MAGGADALSREAALLYRTGRLGAARDTYGRLLALDPHRPNDWLNYGLLLRRNGQHRAALAAYDAALEHGASAAEEIHLNRAVILADDLADAEQARRALETALEIRPDYIPALINLGNIHEDTGDRDAARQAYRQALDLAPDNALALMRLAEVTRFESPDDPLIGLLRNALRRSDLSPLDRADLGYALGRALDQCEDYDAAFGAYRSANEGSRALSAHGYDPAGAEAFVGRIIERFGSEGAGVPSAGEPAPIFVCGMFRSGSTLVERILSSHSALAAGGELPILPRIVREELQPYPDSVAGKDPGFFARLGERYRALLAEMGLDPAGLTDKRPDNFLHVGLIKRMFPAAKIVLTRRNPWDNCLSVYFAHLDPSLTYGSSLDSCAHWYGQFERLSAHWTRLYPDDIHVADYDALVRGPRDEIARLLGFLDLEWEDACLTPHAGSGVVRTASAWQVREPLYKRSSGRWRNYAKHLDALFERFGHPDGS